MSFVNLTSDHKPESPEVFLDTSIFCCMKKGPLFRSRVREVLSLFEWKGTSSYAKVEYGNVVLAQAEYYLRKLNQFGSLEEVRDFIGNVLPHRLHSSKVTWSFNLLLVHYGADDAECTERARLSLRRLMKLGVAFVDQQCDDPVEDGTACYWARRGVQKKRDGTLVWQSPKCKPDNRRCVLDTFFSDNRDTFLKIKSAIDTLPDEERTDQLRAFSAVIGEAAGNPAMLLNYTTGCKRLADAIIAVDSRRYRSLFSQNVAESQVLTRVLNQFFYYIPASQQKPLQVQTPASGS